MTDELTTYTIYDHPADFPEYWVVRSFVVHPGQPAPADHVWLCDSLEAAREQIEYLAPGLVCITRSPGDDPVIVETWL